MIHPGFRAIEVVRETMVIHLMKRTVKATFRS